MTNIKIVMDKWADYCVSQIKWNDSGKRIEEFIVHEDNGDTLSSGINRDRNWVIQKLNKSKTFCTIQYNEKGKWNKTSSIRLDNGALKWNDSSLPLIQTKRKTFISYYHKDNQDSKESFQNLTSDLTVNKSVGDGDINSDVSDEYIKQLIQKGFLSDTTVLVVLIGTKTKCRMHVDWEISGALNLKIGESYAGLLGLLLPDHPDYASKKAKYDLMPSRLADNFKSGYAVIRDYTTDRKKIQEYIELAFMHRTNKSDKRDNSRIQMKKDTCS
jgi:hypothetical protein